MCKRCAERVIQFLLGHVSIQTTERCWAASSGFSRRSMIESESNRAIERRTAVVATGRAPESEANGVDHAQDEGDISCVPSGVR